MTTLKNQSVAAAQRLVPLSAALLPEFRALHLSSGFGGCFCAVWTSFDETWIARCEEGGHRNFEITKARVENGEHVGYLLFAGSEAIGWTGSGPKTSYPLLATKLGSRTTPCAPDVWALGCLAVRADWRGKGIADRIVDLVVQAARENGARVIEAYPVHPWDEDRSYRGSVGLFERHGFVTVGSERDGEHEIRVMHLPLTEAVV